MEDANTSPSQTREFSIIPFMILFNFSSQSVTEPLYLKSSEKLQKGITESRKQIKSNEAQLVDGRLLVN
jgi:hypothetical protein